MVSAALPLPPQSGRIGAPAAPVPLPQAAGLAPPWPGCGKGTRAGGDEGSEGAAGGRGAAGRGEPLSAGDAARGRG